MKLMDYLPHRYWANKSLKKASEQLRRSISDFQREHDIAVELCNEEITSVVSKMNQDLSDLKKKLQHDVEMEFYHYLELQEVVQEYVDHYFARESLLKTKELLKAQADIYGEEIAFYQEQIKYVKEEIRDLGERKDLLASKAEISDILEVLSLLPNELGITEYENASTLLQKINCNIKQAEDISEYKALQSLRMILQERVELLEYVQYISWVISQKNILLSYIEGLLKNSNQKKGECIKQIRSHSETSREIMKRLVSIGDQIKAVWEKPLEEIEEEIEDLKNTRTNTFSDLESVKRRLDSLYGSSYLSSWDRDDISSYKSRRDRIKSKLDRQKREFDDLYGRKKEWNEYRVKLISLLKKYNIRFYSTDERKR